MANSPTSNSHCKSKKKTRRSGQGAWRGVDEISGMRDGWHTIPVKLLSQLGLSFSPPCSTNSSMGLSRYKRIRFRLHVLDSVYCPYWAIQSCRPTIWTKDSRDTSLVLSEFWHDRGGRRRINSGDSMAYEYAIWGCLGFGLTAVRSQALTKK